MNHCACTKNRNSQGSPASRPSHFSVNRALKASLPRQSSAWIQPKLTLNEPGDRYEQEADCVADQVMRMSDGASSTLRAPPQIQRLCAECEEGLQRQVGEEEEEEELIQPKAAEGGTTSDVAAQVPRLQGGGRPLPESARNFFEPRFGHDFSRVRVHADQHAASSARALNARAYTRGHDIAFAAGQYAPHSDAGKRLLAHELTHVVQQSGGEHASPAIQRRLNDGHDLTATRFSGNLILEDVYDNRQLIRRGNTGTAVRLIQQSLMAQGYNLNTYRDDGIFGGETEAAVRQFQIDTGAVKLDGIVGPETMQLLDMHDPGGTATTGPLPAPPPFATPPATAATFSEHPRERFAGYDNTTAPNDSLVVPVNGRRQAQVAVAPIVAVPAPVPTYVSDTPGVATVQPTPDGVAVTGVSDGTAKIEAREGATVLDTLDVEVKNRLDRSVAFHYVCDSRAAAAGGPHCSNGRPSADAMRSLLNRVWERQANVRFTGGTSRNLVVPGDLGAAVDDPNGFGTGEMGTVIGMGAAADYRVFRVWALSAPTQCTNPSCNGGYNVQFNNTFIADAGCADGWGLPHEAGHFLGLNHAHGFIMTTCSGRVDQRVSLRLANLVNP
jgi:peptidoglycan hydrolase-like protein with peptidoglycan-binding domain